MKQYFPKIFLLLVVGVLILLGSAIFSTKQIANIESALPTYPTNQDFEFLNIHELKQRKPTEGLFNTQGYVAKIFSCPPCPEGAVCMPCMEENIVISEQAKVLDSYELTQEDLIIFVQNPGHYFSLGEDYQFSIRVRDSQTTDDVLNDIELVGYRRGVQ